MGDAEDRAIGQAVARGDLRVANWKNGPHVKVDGSWRRYTASMRKAAATMSQAAAIPAGISARRSAAQPTNGDPLHDLVHAGITRLDNGDVQVSRDALQQIRQERLRRVALSNVPSTPRFLTRDAGGMGVARGYGRLHQVTNESLRLVRQRGACFQVIHRARQYQIRHMARPWGGGPRDIGYRVVHKHFKERDKTQPEGFDKIIQQFRRVIERPMPVYGVHTLGELLGPLAEDMHTINRPCCEVIRSLYDHERVLGFRWVDGNLIWPTLTFLEKWKRDNPEWHGQWNPEALTTPQQLEIASAVLDIDLHAGRECVVREGVLEAVLPPDKMIVAPMTTRTSVHYAGYPPSHVEDAIELGVAFINTWDFNTSYFTRGMMAEFALGIIGNTHDEDIDAFVDMFREATQGVERSWQPPVIPLQDKGEIQKIDLKPSNRDMMMEVFMSLQIALCAAIYRMDPSAINAKPWDGGSGPQLSAPNREMEIALAKEEGLQGDLMHLTDHVLRPLARRCHPDLDIVWEFGDQDPLVIADLDERQSRVSVTRNEVRIRNGQQPMGFYLDEKQRMELEEAAAEEEPGDDGTPGPSQEQLDRYHRNLWNQPADATFVNAAQQAQMGPGMGNDEEDSDGGWDSWGWDEGDEAKPKQPEQPAMQKGRGRPVARNSNGRYTVVVYDA